MGVWFFDQMMRVLQENGYLIESLISWLNTPSREKVLLQINNIPLQDSDDILQNQFTEIIQQIMNDLVEKKASKKAAQGNKSLQEWFEIQKKNKS